MRNIKKILSVTLIVLIVGSIIRFWLIKPKEVRADSLFRLDEGYGTTTNESNGSVGAGTITGATWKTDDLCRRDKCLFFDGSGDNVAFSDDVDLDFTATNTFTITGWFRTPDITSGTRVLAAKHNATAGGYKVYMDSSGYLIFGIDDDSTWGPEDTASTSTTAFDDNKWHFFSAVKNETTSISLYVDGILYQTDSSLTATGSLANANTFYLGIDGDGAANDYSGFLDEVKVLRTARTQAQIITDYLSGNTSITGAGPVGWWRMDESSWTNDCATDTVRDSSGNGLDGDACPASTGPTGGATGKYGNAGSFDGTNDKILTPNTGIPTGNSDYSWSAWVYHTGSGIEKFLSWGDNNTNQAVMAGIESGFVVVDHWGDDWTSTCAMPTNTWTHLAGTYSAGTETIYKNGAYCDKKTGIATLNIISGAGNIVIGDIIEDAAAEEFTGTLDDIRVYNYTRSATQILEDMAGYPPSGTSASFGPDTSYLSNGLVGYWKMEEAGDATRADSSGNGNTLTESTADTVAQAAGKFGYAGDFELADTEYMTAADSTSLSVTGSLTLAAWINPETVSVGTYNILAKWDGSNESYRLMQNADEIRIELDASGNYVETSSSNLAAGTWYHVVGVFDATSATAKVFINGLEATSSTTGTIPSSTGDDVGVFHLGAEDSTGGATGYYDGIIDEARVYNRALSPAEVQKLYAWAPGPVGHWKFDENTGTGAVLQDSSGNGNTGTLQADVTASDWVPGKHGSSLDFDRTTNDYVTVADSSSLNFQNLGASVSVWVYWNGSSTADRFISKAQNNSPYEGDFYLQINGQDTQLVIATFRTGSSTNPTVTTTSTMPINTWTHIAATYDTLTNTEKIYFNGVLQETNTSATNEIGNFTGTLCFASNCSFVGGAFPGKLDDIRIYNYARTANQVIEDMNGGHPAPGSPVGSATAYWKFDEGYSTTAYDSNQSTGGVENLTLSTATSAWSNSGKFGKAFYANGARWATIADDNDLDFTASEDITISLWINSTIASAGNPSATEYIINKPPSGATNGGYAVYANTSGQICFGIDDDNTSFPEDSVCTSSDVYDNAWHNIVAVKSGTSRLDMYLDGKANGTPDTSISSTVNTLANSSTLVIASEDTTDDTDDFNGYVDEMQIFRLAFTADQIKVELNRGFGQSMGALSTDSTGAATNSDLDAYCPPGQGSTCTVPVGHWKLDENTGTTAFDSSGNGLTGTLQGSGSLWGPGKLGSAGQFNGNAANTSVHISDNDLLDMPSAFTIELWVNSTDLSSQSSFVSHEAYQSNGYMLGVNQGGPAYVFFRIATAGGSNVTETGTTLSTNQWYHIAAVYDGTNMYLYLNGVRSGTQTASSAPITSSTSFCIGGYTNGGSNCNFSDYKVTGRIDDVRLYNYARTPAQVAWDYNRGAPAGWWKLDETSWNGTASEVKDSSGNANHGVRAGNATTTSSGKLNYAGTFDNSGDYVSITNATPLEITGDLTISAWVKRNSSAAQDTIVDMALDGETEATNHLYHLYFDSSGFLNLIWEYGAGSNQTTQSSVAVSTPTGTWSHIAVTRNVTTNEVKYYENGRQLGSTQSYTNDPTGGTTANLILGAAGSTLADWPFDGLIDDVRLYNYVATPQQIRTAMNEGAATRF